MDWHKSGFNGLEVCVVLDDSSRLVLAGGEFPTATAQASIDFLRMAIAKFEHLMGIREVITDHGSQFFANKTDKNGESESEFQSFLADNGIIHIKSRIKHPQTNGKIEKWYDTYEKNRNRFENFDNFEDSD